MTQVKCKEWRDGNQIKSNIRKKNTGCITPLILEVKMHIEYINRRIMINRIVYWHILEISSLVDLGDMRACPTPISK